MKELLLYGAGRRGKKVADILGKKGVTIAGFLDSNKTGEIMVGEGEYKIFSPDSINLNDYRIMITIMDPQEVLNVKKRLGNAEIVTIEEALNYHNSLGVVENSRNYIADYHKDNMEGYYEEAESEDSLDVFWNKDSEFYKMFSSLDLDCVIELACGRGRHVGQYIEKANKIVLVDIVEKNIAYCKERFSGEEKIEYYVNNGFDLSQLESNFYSALFTYDAMVHFEMLDIFGYLKETQRVLRPGGLALFHHSNNTADYRITFSTGAGGRNYMSAQLFAYLANRAGLKIVKQKVIDWSQKELDCLTLVEKVRE